LENPPLWVWGIIVGAIIAGKFIYRWQATKQFAKEAEERKSKFDDKTKDISNDFYDNMKMKNTRNVRARKYSPRYFYNDYFAIRKEKK
jgi:uncharacterized membrane-anchored protein YhcB (DUF1043 family)